MDFQLSQHFLIFGLGLLMSLARSDIVVFQLPVGFHDLIDVVHGGKQFGHALDIHQQTQHIVAAVFFHGAHTHAQTMELLLLGLPGRLDVLRLFLDHAVVQRDLFLDQSQLFGSEGVAFVQRFLLLDHAGLLFLELLDLRLAAALPLREFFALFLHFVDVGLCDAVSRQRQDKRQHKQQRYDNC